MVNKTFNSRVFTKAMFFFKSGANQNFKLRLESSHLKSSFDELYYYPISPFSSLSPLPFKLSYSTLVLRPNIAATLLCLFFFSNWISGTLFLFFHTLLSCNFSKQQNIKKYFPLGWPPIHMHTYNFDLFTTGTFVCEDYA